MDKTKAIIIVVSLAVLTMVIVGCVIYTSNAGGTAGNRKITAEIRHFDGSTEMLNIKRYSFGYNSMVLMYAEDGRKFVVGPDSVIFIEEYDTNGQ